MSRKEDEKVSYFTDLSAEAAREYDQAIAEVTHLISMDCIRQVHQMQRQLFINRQYLCKERRIMGGEPPAAIRTRHLVK